jgi:hypothetical protein
LNARQRQLREQIGRDPNIAAASLLQDLALLQPTERSRFGYRRAAKAIAAGVDRSRQQHREIDELNARFAGGFRVDKGVEANVLVDGSLDLQSDERAEFESASSRSTATRTASSNTPSPTTRSPSPASPPFRPTASSTAGTRRASIPG